MPDEDEEIVEEAAKPKSKLKLILIAVVLLLLLSGAGGGAYWYFMMGDDAVAEDGVEGEVGEPTEEAYYDEDQAAAIYHKIRPVFITTFSANNRQRYMQVEVTLVTRNEEVVAALVTHQPLVSNALVMLFADSDYLELQTPEGKESLRQSAQTKIESILETEAGIKGLEKVLFTQFVMQ
ncbi:MAG: flagellar FliL protein [Candidatus Azotimanducaceae bacterium]|jgi:flagellar FliL protein